MKLSSWIVAILTCAIITSSLVATKYLQESGAQAAASFEPSETIEIALVQEKLWQSTQQAKAELVAVRSVDIRSELAGRITEVGFAAGDHVKKGQVLLRLDSSEEQARLSAALAEVELAELALQRNQTLKNQGVTSVEAYDRTLAQRNAAVAQAQALKAIIEKKTLIAPFDGEAGLHELELGQYLDAGSNITRLVGSSDHIWVDFQLPQQFAHLNKGDLIEVFPSLSSENSLKAEIIARDAWINNQSRNLRFRAKLQKGEQILHPGSVVNVRVPIGEPELVAIIPSSSVRFDALGANVYVLETDDDGKERARKRKIVLGQESNQYVVVKNGLKADERLAAAGSFKLRDGLLVQVKKKALENEALSKAQIDPGAPQLGKQNSNNEG